MRVLIGFDGSQHTDSALEDIAHAGLPKNVEVMAITVDVLGCGCDFVGATSLSRVAGFMLGSVPTSLDGRTPCSVEIIRAKMAAAGEAIE